MVRLNTRTLLIIGAGIILFFFICNTVFIGKATSNLDPLIIKRLAQLERDISVLKGSGSGGSKSGGGEVSVRTRDIPDSRDPQCHNVDWKVDTLPQATVIIVTHNEKPTTLMRTIKSVLERSHPKLLAKIIIVDDLSDNVVDSEVKILPKVHVIRNQERKGLIHSRVIGAEASKTPVIIFLDAHCEANVNWIEPLIARVHEDPKVVVWPVIDVIDLYTYEYKSIDGRDMTGGLKIETVGYIYENIPKSVFKDINYPFAGVPSPTMPGGLFAIDRQWFFESGTYDLGMGFWGTENVEMSVRLWTCGGRIEMNGCSHVGHVFLDASTAPKYVRESGVTNQIRFAEVWLDDYKHIFYENYRINDEKIKEAGNVDERHEFRKNAQCKSFKWYHENIYPYLEVDPKWYTKGLDLWKKDK